MRDIVNPLVLLVVILLLICRVAMAESAATCDLAAIVICGTAFVVDMSLGVARVSIRRTGFMKVVWAVLFLILGSCVFLFPNPDGGASDPATDEVKQAVRQYRESGDAMTSVDGIPLPVLAAAAGKVHLLRELLGVEAVADDKPLLSLALQRAAEKGHVSVVELLLPHVALNDEHQHSTPLVAAAAAGQVKTLKLLLEAGADPDMADAEGTPPLIHAVLADSVPCVRLLMMHGADASRKDGSDRDAASYSGNDKIDALLEGKPGN